MFQPPGWPEEPLPIRYSEEAEQALLGAILLNNKVYGRVASLLTPEDFGVAVHAYIYQLIGKLVTEGKAADPITLRAHFENDSDLDQVGGADYLVQLVANVVTVVNAVDYANVIRDWSTLRQALFTLEEAKKRVEEEANGGFNIVPAVADAINSLEKINFRGDASKFRSQIVQQILDGMDRKQRRDSTGISVFDNALKGGFYAGFTYGIAAQEKRGKTTLAHSCSYNQNMAGVKHAYIALEMGAKQIEERNLARYLGMNSLEFLKESNGYRKQAIADRVKDIPDNIIYIDMPGGTYEGIKTEIARLHMRHKIRGVYVDYWQLVGGRDKRNTEENHLREVAQGFADLGRRLDIWMVLIAQLNADGTKTFAGSGIKKACDQLYYLHRREDKDELAWMEMIASRYSTLCDVGSKERPALYLNKKIGPYYSDSVPDDSMSLDAY